MSAKKALIWFVLSVLLAVAAFSLMEVVVWVPLKMFLAYFGILATVSAAISTVAMFVVGMAIAMDRLGA